VFWFEDQSAANAIGYWKIAVTLTRPSAPSGSISSAGRSFRARVELHEPVLETLSNSTVSGITPAPTISYVTRSFTDFVMPERASLQNRPFWQLANVLALTFAFVVMTVPNITWRLTIAILSKS
jgi:hypothetical protein